MDDFIQTPDPKAESPSNKYYKNLEDAISEDAYSLIKIFEHVMKALDELNKADLSPNAKYTAQKRAKKFVQDVYAAIPNTYRPAVEEIVQEALFPQPEETAVSEDSSQEPVKDTDS